MHTNLGTKTGHITGANTGFGLQLALKALAEGDRVIAAVRSPSKIPAASPLLDNPNVRILPFDLSLSQPELDAHAWAAFQAFSSSSSSSPEEERGRIDVLVNNAAYAYMGAIEETEDALVKKQFDINVFGILRTIRAFLPGLRAQGSGMIMNVSSIGGLRGYPSNGVYCATKFAVEGITEALAEEIKPFGLTAVIVQPGYFRTSFLAGIASTTAGSGLGRENLAPAIEAYKGTTAHEAREAFWKYDGKQPGDPVEGAKRMWEYVAGEGLFRDKGERLLRLPLGTDTGTEMRRVAGELERTAEYYEEVWRSTDFKD